VIDITNQSTGMVDGHAGALTAQVPLVGGIQDLSVVQITNKSTGIVFSAHIPAEMGVIGHGAVHVAYEPTCIFRAAHGPFGGDTGDENVAPPGKGPDIAVAGNRYVPDVQILHGAPGSKVSEQADIVGEFVVYLKVVCRVVTSVQNPEEGV
jgi:hypothetical protein